MLNKNYTLLWFGQLVSQIGNRLYLMALAWYFVAILKDNNALFLLFIISSLPSLLLGVLAGPLVERWNKKYILIGCDIISGILTGLLAFLVYKESASTWLIYAICFALNSVNLLFSPSVNSMMPAIITKDQLQKGMSYMKMITFLGQILGAALGGVFVALIGVYFTILLNSVSFFISAFTEIFIKYKDSVRIISKSYLKDMKDGLNYVKSNKLVRRVLMITLGSNLFLPALIVLLPIIIKEKMALDAFHYGIADAMLPIGAVIMAVWLSQHKYNIRPLKVLAIGIMGTAFCFFGVSLVHYYAFALAMVLLYGCFTNYVNIQVVTYFIGNVDAEYRGRFFSILESFSYATISLSYVIASLTTYAFDPYLALAINGLGLASFAIIALFWNKKQLNHIS
ncbi:MAG: MFS transporter [Muribaculaceae bacterium]